MKKIKYLLVIIVICIIVFIGIEIFRDKKYDENINDMNSINGDSTDANIVEDKNTNNPNENIAVSTPDIENEVDTNTTNDNEIKNNESKIDEIKNGEELMQKAKTITARGWAGASNNIIGLKDGVLYYYNKGTEEFYPIAEGVGDIYFETEYSEDIIAKKEKNFKEIHEKPIFLVYK